MSCSSLLVVAVYLFLSHLVDAGQDLTRTPGSSGSDVVEASVALVEESAVFADDNQFLRRLAWVESQDGQGKDTYRSGYFGGIWQVDETVLFITQNVADYPGLANIFKSVQVQFSIEWLSVRKEDLLKPLYSALAARIFTWTVSDAIPLASDVQGQGLYWQKHYRNNETVDVFVQLVQQLESLQDCQTRGIDLIFLLDSSGSIGSSNYDKVRDFTADIVAQLNIGPSATQIGLIIFSSSVQVEFHLNTYTNNVSVIHAVENIIYLSGGTNTPEGLETLITEFNTIGFGARPITQGIPRVAIVFTDGQSNEGGGPPATIANAQQVHDNNILTYAVGVGNSVDMNELTAIATSPQYVHLLSDFDINELEQLQQTISYQSCKVPAIADVEDVFDGTLRNEEQAYFQFNLPLVGMTLKIDVDVGAIVVYVSNKIRNPNEAVYDWKLETSTSVDVFISMEGLDIGDLSPPTATPQEMMDTTDTNITVYVSVQGNAEVNNFTLNTTYGNTASVKVATVATGGTGDTESNISMVTVWIVVGGTLLVGLIIAIITIVIIVEIKRFAGYSHQTRRPPYTAVALNQIYDND